MADTEKPGLVPEPAKAMKVFSSDRSIRKGITCSNYQHCVSVCKEKFEIEEEVTLVLEEDGTEVDSQSYWASLNPQTVLMVLRPGVVWQPLRPTPCTGTGHDDTGAGSSSGGAYSIDNNTGPKADVMGLLQKIREKKRKSQLQQSLGKKKKLSTSSIQVGWMHFLYGERRYAQVKSSRGSTTGGTGTLSLPSDSTYGLTLNRLEERYFPNGQNSKGKIRKMETKLGTSKGEVIPETSFPLDNYLTNVVCTQKPRIYLLTKEKSLFFDIEGLETGSSDSDGFDLPDPFVEYSHVATSTSPNVFTMGNVTTPASQVPVTPTTTMPVVTPPVRPITTILTPISTMSAIPAPTTPVNVQTPASTLWVNAGTPTVSMRLPTDGDCGICTDRLRSAFLVPCGHTFCIWNQPAVK
ncbi:uncharacterized protein LOC110466454 [Mizuhopecten yessoensis]|uniref:uncharacterized protein LOC110466454 n=1 Tax=Mizuhopecten yessoensis TaxID=6573 RepID=UPI000B45B5FD|nr:uncharacterized protein LOC110466454 [Mizuhopecten yessoensis]